MASLQNAVRALARRLRGPQESAEPQNCVTVVNLSKRSVFVFSDASGPFKELAPGARYELSAAQRRLARSVHVLEVDTLLRVGEWETPPQRRAQQLVLTQEALRDATIIVDLQRRYRVRRTERRRSAAVMLQRFWRGKFRVVRGAAVRIQALVRRAALARRVACGRCGASMATGLSVASSGVRGCRHRCCIACMAGLVQAFREGRRASAPVPELTPSTAPPLACPTCGAGVDVATVERCLVGALLPALSDSQCESGGSAASAAQAWRVSRAVLVAQYRAAHDAALERLLASPRYDGPAFRARDVAAYTALRRGCSLAQVVLYTPAGASVGAPPQADNVTGRRLLVESLGAVRPSAAQRRELSLEGLLLPGRAELRGAALAVATSAPLVLRDNESGAQVAALLRPLERGTVALVAPVAHSRREARLLLWATVLAQARMRGRRARRTQQCGICLEQIPLPGLSRTSKNCAHRFCSRCLKKYYQVGGMRLHLQCPHAGCGKLMSVLQITDMTMERWRAEIAEAHRRQLSMVMSPVDALREEDRAFVKWARDNTSSCPGCQVLVWKDGGCGTVHCSCGTSYQHVTLALAASKAPAGPAVRPAAQPAAGPGTARIAPKRPQWRKPAPAGSLWRALLLGK